MRVLDFFFSKLLSVFPSFLYSFSLCSRCTFLQDQEIVAILFNRKYFFVHQRQKEVTCTTRISFATLQSKSSRNDPACGLPTSGSPALFKKNLQCDKIRQIPNNQLWRKTPRPLEVLQPDNQIMQTPPTADGAQF